MVKARQKNAKGDANPRVTKFSKEQNDLKIKQVQEYSRHAAGKYPLNLYVLGFNYSSTEAEMKKPIIPWLVDFTLKKNWVRHYRNDENDKRG